MVYQCNNLAMLMNHTEHKMKVGKKKSGKLSMLDLIFKHPPLLAYMLAFTPRTHIKSWGTFWSSFWNVKEYSSRTQVQWKLKLKDRNSFMLYNLNNFPDILYCQSEKCDKWTWLSLLKVNGSRVHYIFELILRSVFPLIIRVVYVQLVHGNV